MADLQEITNAINSIIGFLREQRERTVPSRIETNSLTGTPDNEGRDKTNEVLRFLSDDGTPIPDEVAVDTNGGDFESKLAELEREIAAVGATGDFSPKLLPNLKGGGTAFAVLVTMDGGVVGSDSTECTYTYTVKALDDTTVLKKNTAGDNATGMTPEVPRLHYIGYWYAGETRTAPAVATSRYGLAAYDADGDLHLLVCYGEIGKDDAC